MAAGERCENCGLTPRSSGAPTAGHQARAAPWFILHRAGLASCRRRPLSSNVRRRRPAAVPYQVFADAVLLLHVAVVAFVVLGLPAIFIGNWRKMAWANAIWWRSAHLLAIAVVVFQAWLGQYCGLTVLESWLRQQAGEAGYQRGFLEHWLQQVLYYEGPLWVFALAYTVFGALVLLAWWRYPPKSGHAARGDA